MVKSKKKNGKQGKKWIKDRNKKEKLRTRVQAENKNQNSRLSAKRDLNKI